MNRRRRELLMRLHRDERGFALVTAIVLLSVMTMLMVVSLSAGESAFRISERGSRWNRALQVAEAGVNDAVTRLGQTRLAVSDCPIGGGTPCQLMDAEYEVSWANGGGGAVVIDSVGYYPSVASAQLQRHVQVTYEPIPVFRYALFSSETLTLKNNEEIVGDVYATSGVTMGNNAVVCGSIVTAAGNVDMSPNATVRKSYTTSLGNECTGKEGDVHAGGSITVGGQIYGDATASAPSATVCSPASTSYQITGGQVDGNATACGRITSTVLGTSTPGTATDQPAVQPIPGFEFDPDNYSGLTCIPSVGTCAETNTSATAVSQFNAISKVGMQGSYAIWQTQPTKTTKIDLQGLSLSGDLVIVTNAPIDLGNAAGAPITTSAVPGSVLVIVSLYIPPVGTTCNENGGDCSIYGKNQVVFDGGDPLDPDDGVAGMLYTPGKMAMKNSGNAAEGAMYAGSMDLKNGFEVVYNSRIERVLGFGQALEQTLWQELDPS